MRAIVASCCVILVSILLLQLHAVDGQRIQSRSRRAVRVARDVEAVVGDEDGDFRGASVAPPTEAPDQGSISAPSADDEAPPTTGKPRDLKDKEAHIIIVKGPLKNILSQKNRNAISNAINKSSDKKKLLESLATTAAPVVVVVSNSTTGKPADDKKKTVIATTVEKGSAGGKAKKVTTTKVSKEADKPDKPVTVESVTEESNAKGQPSKVTVNKMKISPTTTKKPAGDKQTAAPTSAKPTAAATSPAPSVSIVDSSVAGGSGGAAAVAKAKGVSASAYKELCEALPEKVRTFCLLIPSIVAKNVDLEMAATHGELPIPVKLEATTKAPAKVVVVEKRVETDKPAAGGRSSLPSTTAKPTSAAKHAKATTSKPAPKTTTAAATTPPPPPTTSAPVTTASPEPETTPAPAEAESTTPAADLGESPEADLAPDSRTSLEYVTSRPGKYYPRTPRFGRKKRDVPEALADGIEGEPRSESVSSSSFFSSQSSSSSSSAAASSQSSESIVETSYSTDSRSDLESSGDSSAKADADSDPVKDVISNVIPKDAPKVVTETLKKMAETAEKLVGKPRSQVEVAVGDNSAAAAAASRAEAEPSEKADESDSQVAIGAQTTTSAPKVAVKVELTKPATSGPRSALGANFQFKLKTDDAGSKQPIDLSSSFQFDPKKHENSDSNITHQPAPGLDGEFKLKIGASDEHKSSDKESSSSAAEKHHEPSTSKPKIVVVETTNNGSNKKQKANSQSPAKTVTKVDADKKPSGAKHETSAKPVKVEIKKAEKRIDDKTEGVSAVIKSAESSSPLSSVKVEPAASTKAPISPKPTPAVAVSRVEHIDSNGENKTELVVQAAHDDSVASESSSGPSKEEKHSTIVHHDESSKSHDSSDHDELSAPTTAAPVKVVVGQTNSTAVHVESTPAPAANSTEPSSESPDNAPEGHDRADPAINEKRKESKAPARKLVPDKKPDGAKSTPRPAPAKKASAKAGASPVTTKAPAPKVEVTHAAAKHVEEKSPARDHVHAKVGSTSKPAAALHAATSKKPNTIVTLHSAEDTKSGTKKPASAHVKIISDADENVADSNKVKEQPAGDKPSAAKKQEAPKSATAAPVKVQVDDKVVKVAPPSRAPAPAAKATTKKAAPAEPAKVTTTKPAAPKVEVEHHSASTGKPASTVIKVQPAPTTTKAPAASTAKPASATHAPTTKAAGTTAKPVVIKVETPTTTAAPEAPDEPEEATSAAPTTASPSLRTSSAKPSPAVVIKVEPSAKPTTTSAKPTTTSAKPTITSAKPATTSAAPATTSAKPATTSEKPATTSAKPAATSERPAQSSAKPTTTTGKPTTTSAPSVVVVINSTSAAPAATSRAPAIKVILRTTAKPTPVRVVVVATKAPASVAAPEVPVVVKKVPVVVKKAPVVVLRPALPTSAKPAATKPVVVAPCKSADKSEQSLSVKSGKNGSTIVRLKGITIKFDGRVEAKTPGAITSSAASPGAESSASASAGFGRRPSPHRFRSSKKVSIIKANGVRPTVRVSGGGTTTNIPVQHEILLEIRNWNEKSTK